MLAIDEIVDHVHGAGAVERVERDQILDAVRLIAAQNVAHAGGFELEHAAGVGLAENLLVGFLIVERQVFDVQLHAAMAFDQLERVLDDGQGGQPQEIHLEQAELLQAHHVVLGDDFVFVGLVERNQFPQRQRRDHHAGRVDAGIARHALQALRDVQDFLDAGLLAGQLVDLRLHLARLGELDVQRHGRDQLGDPVHVGIADVQDAADVLDRRARAHACRT